MFLSLVETAFHLNWLFLFFVTICNFFIILIGFVFGPIFADSILRINGIYFVPTINGFKIKKRSIWAMIILVVLIIAIIVPALLLASEALSIESDINDLYQLSTIL